MTKQRRPVTVADAVTRILGGLTPEGAAEAVGRSAAHVRRWSDPDQACEPTITQALALDAAYVAAGCGTAPILAVYAARMEAMTGGASAVPGEAPAARLLGITAEVGRVADAVHRGLHPDGPGGTSLTPSERRTVADRAMEALAAVTALIRDMEGGGTDAA